MKKSLLAVLAFSGAMLCCHVPAVAQDNAAQAGANQNSIDQDILLLRKDIRSQKKQLIAANVPLTDAEAQKFWPVYEEFTEQLVMINNDKYALIKEYAQSYNNMTDAQADDWTQRLLKVDASVAALRQRYWSNFSKVLPPKKVALYEQVERRAQLLIDLQLSSQIPLVQP
jgi:septal ring factor EnvC (AmiA/AmiB activator)